MTSVTTLIYNNDIEGIENLIRNGFDPNSSTYGNVSDLSYAISMTRSEISKIFIQAGAIVSVNDVLNSFFLNDVELTEALMLRCPDFDVSPPSNGPLKRAVSLGNTDLVFLLVSYGASVSRKDSYGKSILENAVEASSSNYAMVRYLLTLGAFVNEDINRDENKLLLLALKKYHFDIAKLLIDAGADLDIIDIEDRTPIMYGNATEAPIALLERLILPETINFTDRYGMTALMHAVIKPNRECLELLIRRGADINLRDNLNRNALDLALDTRDRNGRRITPDPAIVKILEDAGLVDIRRLTRDEYD